MRSARSSGGSFAVLALLASCQREGAREAPKVVEPPAAAVEPPAAAVEPPAAAVTPDPRPAEAGPLTWIHDDYPAALARAKAEGLPVFVDLWAAWCHTCVAMQETVLRDPAMAPFADRFVWLAIDTERPSSAAIVAKLPTEVWPTFYVLSPDGAIQARHLGGGSIDQIRELLTAGEAGHLAALAKSGGLAPDSALWLVREGDRAAAARRFAAADRAFARALAKSPRDWPRAPDVLVRQINARSRAGDEPGCVALGLEALDRTLAGHTASATDFAATLERCAVSLPADQATALRKRLLAHLTALLAAPDAALSIDDRSDAMNFSRSLLEQLGEGDRAKALAEEQRVLLDRAMDEAKTPWEAQAYLTHRIDVYMALGRIAELLPVVRKNEADLPNNYDAPYRLAQVLLAVGQHDEAIAAGHRALALVQGPRRVRVLALLADALHAKGDHAGEKQMREKQVAVYATLAPGQKRASAEADAKKALADHDAEHAARAPR